METKTCARCRAVKALDEFGAHMQHGKQRRRSYCKPCHSANVREARQRNLEVHKERERVYARTHAQEARERARRWYAENADRGKANARRRYKEKPELVVADTMVQRARNAGAPLIERFTRDEIVRRDLGTCQICLEPVNPNLPRNDRGALNLDHIIPLRDGGSHTRENVRVTHRYCNLTRSTKVA